MQGGLATIAWRSGHDWAAIVSHKPSMPSDLHQVEWTIVIARSSCATIVSNTSSVCRPMAVHRLMKRLLSHGDHCIKWVEMRRVSSSDTSWLQSVTTVRWRSLPSIVIRSMKIKHSWCVHASPGDRLVHLINPDFAHVCWWMIAWTQVHAIDASHLDPMLALPPSHLHRGNVWEHSPTLKKKWETVSFKGGAAKRYCVTTPIL